MAKRSDTDSRGDGCECLLSKLSAAGVNGEMCTPRHLIRMTVELMQPKPEDLIRENCAASLVREAA